MSKLIEARSLGKADPSLIDDFIKDNLERKWVNTRITDIESRLQQKKTPIANNGKLCDNERYARVFFVFFYVQSTEGSRRSSG